MNTTVYRFDVPVDDQVHEFALTGEILHVGCRYAATVEFWAWQVSTTPPRLRRLRVFGTGQPMPAGVEYVGTAVAPGGQLVWHLMEVPDGG